METFAELGRRLEATWRAHDYAAARFPELAADAIAESDVLGAVDGPGLLSWIARAETLPNQIDPTSRFGDLALTLFEAPRFFVSALFWLDGSTEIHQHSFSGAFAVIGGSSIHSRYRFAEERAVSARFRTGALALDSVELLGEGAIRPIPSGDGFIHALFHLERPAVSLVVRTHTDADAHPQWSYRPPGIAEDPFTVDGFTTRKREAIRMLLTQDADFADAEIGAMLECADLQLGFSLLDVLDDELCTHAGASASSAADQRFDAFAATLRARHGAVVDRFVASFAERARQRRILALRGLLTRPEQRFLLALLLNFPGIEPVIELLQQRYPERDPHAEFVDRIEELGNTRVQGSSEANVLGVERFDVEHRIVLEQWLRGGATPEAAAALVERLGDPPDEAKRVAEQVAAELRAAPLLWALFGA